MLSLPSRLASQLVVRQATRASRMALPPETWEQPSLVSGLSDAPWLNRRRHGSLYSIIEYESTSHLLPIPYFARTVGVESQPTATFSNTPPYRYQIKPLLLGGKETKLKRLNKHHGRLLGENYGYRTLNCGYRTPPDPVCVCVCMCVHRSVSRIVPWGCAAGRVCA
jgi:hypothetical protein